MPHSLLRKPVHGNTSKENNAAQAALNENRFVGAIYVGRRKVWEGRASTREAAFNKAKAEQSKYSGTKSEVRVNEVKAVQK